MPGYQPLKVLNELVTLDDAKGDCSPLVYDSNSGRVGRKELQHLVNGVGLGGGGPIFRSGSATTCASIGLTRRLRTRMLERRDRSLQIARRAEESAEQFGISNLKLTLKQDELSITGIVGRISEEFSSAQMLKDQDDDAMMFARNRGGGGREDGLGPCRAFQ